MKRKFERDHRVPSGEEIETVKPGMGEECADAAREIFEAAVAVDPTCKLDPLNTIIFAQLATGTASEVTEQIAGKFLARMIRDTSSAYIERTFGEIVAMKREAERKADTGETDHRNARALQGYNEFVRLAGRDPSKPELKAFLRSDAERWGDLPGDDDPKAWTRMWKLSGLSHLADR